MSEFYKYIEELWETIPTNTLTELVDYIDSLGHIDILNFGEGMLVLTSHRFVGQYLKLEYYMDSYSTKEIFVNGYIDRALFVVEKKDKLITVYE